jgi:hypothetical protein
MNNEFAIFAGTANPDLGAAVAHELHVGRGACRAGLRVISLAPPSPACRSV